MSDGSQPLDPKREKFIKRLMAGDSAAEAYRTIYPKASQRTSETDGPILKKEPAVSLRFHWFQKKTEGATVLTQKEKRERLARVVREDQEEIRDILAAIKIDNEMDPDARAPRLEITVDAAKLEFLARIKTRSEE